MSNFVKKDMDVLKEYYHKNESGFNELLLNLQREGLYDNCSFPQLMALWEEEEIPKLMFIGQEPYGWGGDDNIDSLIKEYLKFNLGENYYNSPFWSWTWYIAEVLGYQGKHPFFYNNINKISNVDGGPAEPKVTELENKYFNLLIGEIETLKPEICIFLSGPNYDQHLENKIGKFEKEQIEGFKERQLVKLKSPRLPLNSFRMYHPNYGNRNQELYHRCIQAIKNIVDKKAFLSGKLGGES